MSRFRRFEIMKHAPSCSIKETSIFDCGLLNPCFPAFPFLKDQFDYVSDHLSLAPSPPVLLHQFDNLTDLIQIEESPFYLPNRRVTRYIGLDYGTDLYLQLIGDRLSDLELRFDRLVREKNIGDRKYTWTAEIKSPETLGLEFDGKYKLSAEINENKGFEKNFKWSAKIKGKGGECVPIERTYTLNVKNRYGGGESEKDKKKKKKSEKAKGKAHKAEGSTPRIVEIEGPSAHGAVVLRQVFGKRVEKSRGKRRVLSPQDAASLIQISFRAYLIRRSQTLRALRELAVAKTKLKEIRVLFSNFSYRRRLTRDAEERQRFSEKIIVLLLTVDAIEGADLMVRAAKKSMVDELEAMLDVVDPQPPGKSLSMRRRTFDMPDSVINKELAAGVAQVVQILDQEVSG